MVLFNVTEELNKGNIMDLFAVKSRVDSISFFEGAEVDQLLKGYSPLENRYFPKPSIIIKRACVLNFCSNSAARKTIDSLMNETYQFYWMNINGRILRIAEPYKRKSISSGSSASNNYSQCSSPLVLPSETYSDKNETTSVCSFDSEDSCTSKQSAWSSCILSMIDEDDCGEFSAFSSTPDRLSKGIHNIEN